MANKETIKRYIKERLFSDQNLKIYGKDGKVIAEMTNGEWIKRPKK